MRTGTPNFNGERLREAREARGLTAINFADLIGVSRQAVSQYENGKTTPHPSVMEEISKALNLPLEFFRQDIDEYEESIAIYFRSLSLATKGPRNRAKRRHFWLFKIVDYLEQYVILPRIILPDFVPPSTPMEISAEDIEYLAAQTRKIWGLGLGPISNVVRLLEKNGIIVSRYALDSNSLDAFSLVRKGKTNTTKSRPYVCLGTEKGASVRSRFEAAHELGHIILHPPDLSEKAQRMFQKIMEEQAHRFAGAFLLPEESFKRDVIIPSLDTFRVLKSKWLVSIQAMIKRCQHLGLISEEEERRLWVALGKKKWKLKEPLDDTIPVEEPKLLRMAFEMLINSGVQTRDQIKHALPYARTDIEQLAGLSDGFLKDPPPELKWNEVDQKKVIQLPHR